MADRIIIQELEIVVTDSAVIADRGFEHLQVPNMIAVIRPVSRRRPWTMPQWAAGPHCTAIVARDGASGLKIRPASGFWTFLDEWQILVDGIAPIGMLRRSPRSGLTFRECTCGQRPRKCQCRGRHGKVCFVAGSSRPERARARRHPETNAWTVVDAAGDELARITQRWYDTDLGPEKPREMFARWWRRGARAVTPWKPFEVVEVGPGFDWRRHGLVVALAARSCGGFGPEDGPDPARKALRLERESPQ